MNLAKELAKTTILYWEAPDTTFRRVAALLAGNTVLLTFCRSASFGFEKVVVSVIIAFVTFILQYVASITSLLRGAKANITTDAPKLAHLIAITWLVSLVLFLPNAVPPLRWFGLLKFPVLVSLLHSILAVGLLAYYSLSIMSAKESDDDVISKCKKQVLGWSVFLVFINTILFYVFVLDVSTHFWFADNLEDIHAIFR